MTEREEHRLGEWVARVPELLGGDELGFVATPTTHWHALGVEAWLKRARREGEERRGLVFLVPHARDGRLLRSEDLPLADADAGTVLLPVSALLAAGRLRAAAELSRLVLRAAVLLARSPRPTPDVRPLHFLSPKTPDVFALLQALALPQVDRRAVRFAVLDEGVSAHRPVGSPTWSTRADRAGAHRSRLALEGDVLLRRAYWHLQRRVAERFPTVDRYLLRRGGDGALVPVPEIAADYLDAIRAAPHAEALAAIPRDGPVALILTQAWSEYGQLALDDERRVIAAVAAGLQGAGYAVALKRHPRETPAKHEVAVREMGMQVLPTGFPVERLLGALRSGDVVVGDYTSALLTANALFGVPAHSFARWLGEHVELTRRHREAQEQFLSAGRRLVRDVAELLPALELPASAPR